MSRTRGGQTKGKLCGRLLERLSNVSFWMARLSMHLCRMRDRKRLLGRCGELRENAGKSSSEIEKVSKNVMRTQKPVTASKYGKDDVTGIHSLVSLFNLFARSLFSTFAQHKMS